MALPHLVLGIEQGANIEVAKAAYKRLAMKHHPDRHGGDNSKFLEVKAAYEALVAKAASTGLFDDLIDEAAKENKS